MSGANKLSCSVVRNISHFRPCLLRASLFLYFVCNLKLLQLAVSVSRCEPAARWGVDFSYIMNLFVMFMCPFVNSLGREETTASGKRIVFLPSFTCCFNREQRIKAVTIYEIFCISVCASNWWPAYVHVSVQWWWIYIQLFVPIAFGSNVQLINNTFTLGDRSFLPKGQSVIPSDGCLREGFFNTPSLCSKERHRVHLKNQMSLWDLQSWSAHWPINTSGCDWAVWKQHLR